LNTSKRREEAEDSPLLEDFRRYNVKVHIVIPFIFMLLSFFFCCCCADDETKEVFSMGYGYLIKKR
ncbi:MAG: hypothetical protein ACJ71R_14345, partial [Nitrososphaeraceae archaeon]